ncbi:unnamed protein product [Linum trigynum]|uniref:Uncharacterized protein n=1 Tax=Linum trigynum TaxID=586398 RepID=A0AAV2DCU4_9ROSI
MVFGKEEFHFTFQSDLSILLFLKDWFGSPLYQMYRALENVNSIRLARSIQLASRLPQFFQWKPVSIEVTCD